MLLFVSERAGHAATSHVQHRHVQAGDQPQRRRRPAHADQRFLMAMTVQHALFLKRPQPQGAASFLDLLRQPAVGQVCGRRDALHVRSRRQFRPLVGKRQETTRFQAEDGCSVGDAPRQRRRLGLHQRPRGPQESFTERRPAAAVEIRKLDGIARAFQHAHRCSSDGRLVVRREAIIHQEDAPDPAGGGVRLVPGEPAAEMAGVQRR